MRALTVFSEFFDGITSLYPLNQPGEPGLLQHNLSTSGLRVREYHEQIVPHDPLREDSHALEHNTCCWVASESLGIVPGTTSSTSWKVYLGDAYP